jgi:hypothetical protein
MLTQLTTVKARLQILDTDTTYDLLLTNAIKAVSARFDKETRRTLARAENAAFEFPADTAELLVPRYPIETVTKFETKSTEAEGWQEKTGVDYLLRAGCVISLSSPLSSLPASALCRITYTGGYVLPGSVAGPGQAPLPDDLEQAAVEQVAYWFQNREHLGLKTYWPTGVAYQQFAALDLLDSVKAVLTRHTRWSL